MRETRWGAGLIGMNLLVIVWIMSLPGCKSLSPVALDDLSRFYNEKTAPAGFGCSVMNVNDSISNVLTVFPYERLGLVKNPQTGTNTRHFRLTYKLFKSVEDAAILDSASFIFTDSLEQPPPLFSHSRNFRVLSGSNYILQAEITDLAGGHEFMILQPVYKDSPSAASWFGFESEIRGLLFQNYLSEKENYRLLAGDNSLTSITVNCYFRTFPAAIPPFSEESRKPFDYIPDSSFRLPLLNGVSEYVQLPRQGFYFFQRDTALTEGITAYCLYPGYPKVNTPLRMLETMRYITSAQEFRQLLTRPSAKIAVDSFWIAAAGSPERAVELIRDYYRRVEEANRLFFSYCEGWKTDRGIIYIAFGQPNVVYRSDNQELWIYGEASNYRSMRFVFYKVQNPFTDNDYILQRQPLYKDFWYNAIQKWRR